MKFNRYIFRKELLDLWRERTIWWAVGTFIFLLAASAVVSSRFQQQEANEKRLAEVASRKHWEQQTEKNPHSAAHFGIYLFQPQAPLAFIEPGIRKFTGTSAFLEPHRRNEMQFNASQDSNNGFRLGNLTPGFLALYLLPLLVMLTGFGMLSKEREGGTLRFTLSTGVTRNTVVFTKWIVLTLITILFSIPILLLCIAFHPALTREDFGALMILWIVYLLHSFMFANITLLVSALSKSASQTFIMLLAIWMMMMLTIPKLASVTATAAYPLPNLKDFQSTILADKEMVNGHGGAWSEKLLTETLSKFGVDSVQQLPFNFAGLRLEVGEERETALYRKHYNNLLKQREKQGLIYDLSGILSPLIPFHSLATAIAKTDVTNHRAFEEAAEQYRYEFVQVLNRDVKENSRWGENYYADTTLWKKIPPFEYTSPPLSETLESHQGALLIAAVWLAVSLLAIFVCPRFLSNE